MLISDAKMLRRHVVAMVIEGVIFGFGGPLIIIAQRGSC